jgi:tetratricopeptide (TPR) repeat protein
MAAGAGRVSAQSVTVTPPVVDLDAVQVQLDVLDSVMGDIGREVGEAIALKMDAKVSEKVAEKLEAKFQNPNPNAQGPRPNPRPVVVRGGNNEDRLYQEATRSLDNGRWDEAVRNFQRVIAIGGSRADGATYWIAWAQNKQGNSAAALESLTRLRQTYANSRWINEARALEVEIRQAAGQPVRPESAPDDELKLMALNSLVKANESRAIPMLEKIVKGTGSPRLKERALFVLAQNGSNQARQIVTEIAKGGGNPDLQAKAVSYLGVFGGNENKQVLLEIYKSSTNLEVKRSILRAFMTAGDRDQLLNVAKSEQSSDLRAEAVAQLGGMGAQDELWQLYQSDLAPEVRKKIIQAMFAGHNEDRLIQLLKKETEPELRRAIVQNLGMMVSPASAEALASVYASDKDETTRRSVIDALYQQRNGKMLVEVARKETDPNLKRRIVERLSNMKSAEATDYFMELLSKP